MRTNNLAAFLTGAMAVAAALPASAGDFEKGVFLSAGIGTTDTDFRPTITDVIDDDDSSFELGVGYAFNRNFSVLGRYHDFGEPTGFAGCPPDVLCIQAYSPEKVEVDGWSASIEGVLPINERFAAVGRLGLLSWDASARSPTLNDSGTDLLYGVGLSLKLSPNWGVQLNYERTHVDIGSVTLSASYRL